MFYFKCLESNVGSSIPLFSNSVGDFKKEFMIINSVGILLTIILSIIALFMDSMGFVPINFSIMFATILSKKKITVPFLVFYVFILFFLYSASSFGEMFRIFTLNMIIFLLIDFEDNSNFFIFQDFKNFQDLKTKAFSLSKLQKVITIFLEIFAFLIMIFFLLVVQILLFLICTWFKNSVLRRYLKKQKLITFILFFCYVIIVFLSFTSVLFNSILQNEDYNGSFMFFIPSFLFDIQNYINGKNLNFKSLNQKQQIFYIIKSFCDVFFLSFVFYNIIKTLKLDLKQHMEIKFEAKKIKIPAVFNITVN